MNTKPHFDCPCCGRPVETNSAFDFTVHNSIKGQKKKVFTRLFNSAGRLVTYRALSEEIWPIDADLPDNYVASIAQVVFYLRKRLVNSPYSIESFPNEGYVLKISSPAAAHV